MFNAFDDAITQYGNVEVFENTVSGDSVRWVPIRMIRGWVARGKSGWIANIAETQATRLRLGEPGADGVLIAPIKDVNKAEQLLFNDVVRKKGGYLAKIFNEHISLWIARKLAHTPVTPNQVTL